VHPKFNHPGILPTVLQSKISQSIAVFCQDDTEDALLIGIPGGWADSRQLQKVMSWSSLVSVEVDVQCKARTRK